MRWTGGKRAVASVLLLLLLVSGCRSRGGTKPAPQYQIGTAAALSSRLTAGNGLADSLAATLEALALGGVATWDGKRILMEAAAPAATTLAIPEETVALAIEARQRASAGRLTLDQLGEMLRDMGWPFQDGSTPGQQLQWILEGWVRDGLTDPRDPLSFAPLFLYQMAQAQQPPINLSGASTYAPEDLRLTLLELYLFAAHFDRLSRPAGAAAGHGSGYAWFSRTAHAAEPCSDAKKWLGQQTGKDRDIIVDAGQILGGEGVTAGLKAALERAGFTEAETKKFEQALGSLNIAKHLWKLVAVYSHAQIEVIIESENPVHKFLESEGRLLTAFKARAGVSEEDWKEYQKSISSSEAIRALRDCINASGLPTLPDLGDLGKMAENWDVEWRLPKGMPHGFTSLDVNDFYLPGQLQMKLKRETDHTATAILTVDITPEKGKAHTGREKTAQVIARADLETAEPPSLQTWVNGLKGGRSWLSLAEALVELSAGWIQDMVKPRAYGVLDVTYHEGGGAWTGTITYAKTRTQDETESSEDGPAGYPSTEHRYESFDRQATIRLSRSEVTGVTPLEELYSLRGQANVTYREEHLHEQKWEAPCKKGKMAQDEYFSLIVEQGTVDGPAEVRLTIQNDGRYSISVRSLPEATGTVQTDAYKRSSDVCTRPWTDSGTKDGKGMVENFGFSGRMDPNSPDAIKGRYDQTDGNGYRVVITWNLSRGASR